MAAPMTPRSQSEVERRTPFVLAFVSLYAGGVVVGVALAGLARTHNWWWLAVLAGQVLLVWANWRSWRATIHLARMQGRLDELRGRP